MVLSERGVVGQGLDQPTATETQTFYLAAKIADPQYLLGQRTCMSSRATSPVTWTVVLSEHGVVRQRLDHPTAMETRPFYQNRHYC